MTMFLSRTPTADDLHHYLQAQRREAFSYPRVGGTRNGSVHGSTFPSGFNVDRHEVLLGESYEIFQAACEAVRGWKMFPQAMASLFWPSVPVVAGHEVVVGFRMGPLWSLNPCRIVYTIDDTVTASHNEIVRFGFAYGTLPGHVERGEERFLVQWDRETDRVSYEILCFSAAQHFLAKIGYPFVRYQQARFRRLSGEAMQSAVATSRRVADAVV